MRRVVVTGLGIVRPLGCGVDTTWSGILAGKSGAAQIDEIRGLRSSLQDRLRRPARRRLRRHLQSPTSGWSRKNSARSTTSSSSRWPRRRRRSTTPAGIRKPGRPERDRRSDRLGHWRHRRHRRRRDHAQGAGPAPRLAVLHSRPPDQSRRRAMSRSRTVSRARTTRS